MASEKNLITISSTNCRGLGEYTKRKDVFNYLRNKGHNIYCLQDTHFTKSMADDTTILLDGSENSLNEALKILNKFALASGLKLNAN